MIGLGKLCGTALRRLHGKDTHLTDIKIARTARVVRWTERLKTRK
jgi:hypothetical protein